MTEPAPLTPEEKTALVAKIRKAREVLQKPMETPLKIFKEAFLWIAESAAALEVLALNKMMVSGRFQDVANYVKKQKKEPQVPPEEYEDP